jgi:hypothetical protein
MLFETYYFKWKIKSFFMHLQDIRTNRILKPGNFVGTKLIAIELQGFNR